MQIFAINFVSKICIHVIFAILFILFCLAISHHGNLIFILQMIWKKNSCQPQILRFLWACAFILKSKSFSALYIEHIDPPKQKHLCLAHVNIIFQTVWHFASKSGLKFSHNNYNKDNDWIFDLNESCTSNRKANNTMTNRNVCRARFCKQNTYFI